MTAKLRIRKTKRYDDEVIYSAKFLYLKKWTPNEIAKELGLNSARPIYYWAEKYNWRNLINENGIEELIALRIITLTERENKTDQEIKELEALIDKDIEYKKQRAKKAASSQKSAVTLSESFGDFADSGDGNDGDNKKKSKKRAKNDISHVTPEMVQPFVDSLFEYQKHCRANKHHSVRNILKSRQIGATYYFAFEALEDAIFTGDNQIFLSASKRQAEIFKTYIIKMAREYFDVELKGSPIILSNGAELHFLATNANTSQGNSGHVYGDEYAWIRDFERFNTVSSAMATHKHWRETYFSTPSSKFHPSYAFWSGDMWKEGDPKRANVVFPSFEELRDGGRVCPDGTWRYVITIEDALKGGAGVLFDIDALKQKYSKYAFAQLFMCVWVDDADSIFNIKKLLKCGVDIAKWKDHNPNDARPFGAREVWGGYDPAHSGDGASFVIVAPPALLKEKYRVLARYQWNGLSYKYQAAQIKQLFEKYNMTYIGIDATGVGYGVYEQVKEFAGRKAVPLVYNPESKTEMVLKVHDLVEHEQIEWNENERDIVPSFLMIKHTSTKSGNTMTFVAERTVKTQHADVFFAIANAINNKSLTDKPRRKSRGWRM
ncbi:terminase ATPase subunit family protein [Pasteurella multocida]|uniref:terminase ATPase subunit family protein n=1 Tax=Pasteurella multocida TaxID=747 RepID=UPI002BC3133F|nr:terminase ATPase subunit family protein [Pasteurella multocida]MEB3457145.1 terminase ATPase subunit family protein [Pasteurella multocida]